MKRGYKNKNNKKKNATNKEDQARRVGGHSDTTSFVGFKAFRDIPPLQFNGMNVVLPPTYAEQVKSNDLRGTSTLLPRVQVYYQGNDASLQVIFKSLSKRDDMTKTKALISFHEYLQKSDVSSDNIATAWAPWSYWYPHLCLSDNRRIRILTQQIFNNLLKRSKSYCAEYFPELLPMWFLSMGDPVLEVARAAKECIETINWSKSNQLRQALLLVGPELVTLLSNVFQNETSETLWRAEITEEQARDRWELVMLMSINAVVFLASIAADEPCIADEELDSASSDSETGENELDIDSNEEDSVIPTFRQLVTTIFTQDVLKRLSKLQSLPTDTSSKASSENSTTTDSSRRVATKILNMWIQLVQLVPDLVVDFYHILIPQLFATLGKCPTVLLRPHLEALVSLLRNVHTGMLTDLMPMEQQRAKYIPSILSAIQQLRNVPQLFSAVSTLCRFLSPEIWMMDAVDKPRCSVAERLLTSLYTECIDSSTNLLAQSKSASYAAHAFAETICIIASSLSSSVSFVESERVSSIQQLLLQQAPQLLKLTICTYTRKIAQRISDIRRISVLYKLIDPKTLGLRAQTDDETNHLSTIHALIYGISIMCRKHRATTLSSYDSDDDSDGDGDGLLPKAPESEESDSFIPMLYRKVIDSAIAELRFSYPIDMEFGIANVFRYILLAHKKLAFCSNDTMQLQNILQKFVDRCNPATNKNCDYEFVLNLWLIAIERITDVRSHPIFEVLTGSMNQLLSYAKSCVDQDNFAFVGAFTVLALNCKLNSNTNWEMCLSLTTPSFHKIVSHIQMSSDCDREHEDREAMNHVEPKDVCICFDLNESVSFVGRHTQSAQSRSSIVKDTSVPEPAVSSKAPKDERINSKFAKLALQASVLLTLRRPNECLHEACKQYSHEPNSTPRNVNHGSPNLFEDAVHALCKLEGNMHMHVTSSDASQLLKHLHLEQQLNVSELISHVLKQSPTESIKEDVSRAIWLTVWLVHVEKCLTITDDIDSLYQHCCTMANISRICINGLKTTNEIKSESDRCNRYLQLLHSSVPQTSDATTQHRISDIFRKYSASDAATQTNMFDSVVALLSTKHIEPLTSLDLFGNAAAYQTFIDTFINALVSYQRIQPASIIVALTVGMGCRINSIIEGRNKTLTFNESEFLPSLWDKHSPLAAGVAAQILNVLVQLYTQLDVRMETHLVPTLCGLPLAHPDSSILFMRSVAIVEHFICMSAYHVQGVVPACWRHLLPLNAMPFTDLIKDQLNSSSNYDVFDHVTSGNEGFIHVISSYAKLYARFEDEINAANINVDILVQKCVWLFKTHVSSTKFHRAIQHLATATFSNVILSSISPSTEIEASEYFLTLVRGIYAAKASDDVDFAAFKYALWTNVIPRRYLMSVSVSSSSDPLSIIACANELVATCHHAVQLIQDAAVPFALKAIGAIMASDACMIDLDEATIAPVLTFIQAATEWILSIENQTVGIVACIIQKVLCVTHLVVRWNAKHQSELSSKDNSLDVDDSPQDAKKSMEKDETTMKINELVPTILSLNSVLQRHLPNHLDFANELSSIIHPFIITHAAIFDLLLRTQLHYTFGNNNYAVALLSHAYRYALGQYCIHQPYLIVGICQVVTESIETMKSELSNEAESDDKASLQQDTADNTVSLLSNLDLSIFQILHDSTRTCVQTLRPINTVQFQFSASLLLQYLTVFSLKHVNEHEAVTAIHHLFTGQTSSQTNVALESVHNLLDASLSWLRNTDDNLDDSNLSQIDNVSNRLDQIIDDSGETTLLTTVRNTLQLSARDDVLQLWAILATLMPRRIFKWYSNLPRMEKHKVWSAFKESVTPMLLEHQLKLVQQKVASSSKTVAGTGFQSAQEAAAASSFLTGEAAEFFVRCDLSSREIHATYVHEEAKLNITVRISKAYPLEPVEVVSEQKVGVPEGKLRRWQLQMSQLMSRTGAFWDALCLWRDSLKQEFDGVEPCPICYSVLHLGTRKLPRTNCNVCNSKFHSACLMKWFKSSGDSKCPMCRSNFFS